FGDALAAAVYDSTSNKVIFRLGSAESAEQIARLIGTKTVSRDLINYAIETKGLNAGVPIPKGMTTVTGEEFIFHPNALKNQSVGEALLILQRRKGREVFHGRLRTCPEGLPRPEASELEESIRPGKAHPALELIPPGPLKGQGLDVSQRQVRRKGQDLAVAEPEPAPTARAGAEAVATATNPEAGESKAEAVLNLLQRSKKRGA
ncbi:MAG: hypothetical protein ACREKE_03500, partial [bacterium]